MPGTFSKADGSAAVRSAIGAVLSHVADDHPPSTPVAVAATVDVTATPPLRDRPRAGVTATPPPRSPGVPMRRCNLDDHLDRPRPGHDRDRGGHPLIHAECDHPED